jgi:hypothetical protein
VAPGTQVARLTLSGVDEQPLTPSFAVLIEAPGRAQGSVRAGGVVGPTGTRVYRLEWPAGAALHVHVRAFRFDSDEKTGASSHFTFMAEFDGTVSADAEWKLDWQPYKGGETQVIVDNTELAPPLDRTTLLVQTDSTIWPIAPFAGNTELAPPLDTTTLLVQTDSTIWPIAPFAGSTRGSVQFSVPTIAGATVSAAASHHEDGVAKYATAASTPLSAKTLKLSAQMSYDRLTASPENHGAAKDLSFAWHAYGNAGYLRLDAVDEPLTHPNVMIMFDGSIEDTKLPDLSEFGLSWPKGTHYIWRLVTTQEQSIEDLAASGMYGVAPAGYGDSHDFTFE